VPLLHSNSQSTELAGLSQESMVSWLFDLPLSTSSRAHELRTRLSEALERNLPQDASEHPGELTLLIQTRYHQADGIEHHYYVAFSHLHGAKLVEKYRENIL
jgi:hypothetical protein